MVINHNAGADKTSSVAWFINKTGDNPEMLAIRYCYQEDSAAEFCRYADKQHYIAVTLRSERTTKAVFPMQGKPLFRWLDCRGVCANYDKVP